MKRAAAPSACLPPPGAVPTALCARTSSSAEPAAWHSPVDGRVRTGEEGRKGGNGRGVEGEEVARVGGEGGGVRTGTRLHTHYTGHVVPECVGGVTHLLELVVFHLDLGVVLDALFGVVLSNQTVVLCQQSGALLKAV